MFITCILQEFGCSKSHHMSVVMKLIHYLYNEDVLSEDVIMQWYKQEPASKDVSQGHSDIRKQVRVFNHAPGEYSC